VVTARKRTTPELLQVVCMLTDQIGDVVYIRGDMNGYYKVARVDVTLSSKIPAIGIIVQKWGFTNALVQITGELKGIYTGLTAGKTYFVGTNGRPNITPPSPSFGGRAYVQPIGVALDQGVLLVRPAENLTIRIG
jgi:hypothetical protein